MQGVAQGLALAAKDRGLDYRVAQADNDPSKMADQVRAFLNEKVGALVIAPVDPPSIAPSLNKSSGGACWRRSAPPATTILNAPRYLTGKVLGTKLRLTYGLGSEGRPRSSSYAR